MPITLSEQVRRLSQVEFGELAFEVMRNVFAIHNELGRFFNEEIYKQELAYRMADVRLEVPIDVVFGSFQKRYFIDALVGQGGVFEFKAVEKLAGPHRAQLLNYLLLCELEHGKLINVRPESVEHEFVNTHWRHADRVGVVVDSSRWNSSVPGADRLFNFLFSVLQDLGAGLEIALYEEAIVHFLGGPSNVEADIQVSLSQRKIGSQRMRLVAPGVAFKLTGFHDRLDAFEEHSRRLLTHLDLHAIAWVNIHVKHVTFTTIQR